MTADFEHLSGLGGARADMAVDETVGPGKGVYGWLGIHCSRKGFSDGFEFERQKVRGMSGKASGISDRGVRAIG
jgi:hypothetical protein